MFKVLEQEGPVVPPQTLGMEPVAAHFSLLTGLIQVSAVGGMNLY